MRLHKFEWMLGSNTVWTRRETHRKRSDSFKNCLQIPVEPAYCLVWVECGHSYALAGAWFCSLPRLAVVNSAGVSSENNSRTAAAMFPSSNLEVIDATLAGSGPHLRLQERNCGMSSSCEPLCLKRLMRAGDKFLFSPSIWKTQKV